jgi:hypothetical protein
MLGGNQKRGRFGQVNKMNLKEAREIGKIRKVIGVVGVNREELSTAIAEKTIAKMDAERKTPQKVEVINQPEVQKVEGKTETDIRNWPNLFQVIGEVVAKVAFPPLQKVVGSVTAKVENWPVLQKITGNVVAEIENFPKIQKVEVTNPTQRMYVEGKQEVINLPLGRSNKEGDPERFLAVRFTDGQHYYDLKEFLVAGGGIAPTMDDDRRWLREDFTYDANNNVTRVVSYDGQGMKRTVDYEYDANNNVTRKTARFEKA